MDIKNKYEECIYYGKGSVFALIRNYKTLSSAFTRSAIVRLVILFFGYWYHFSLLPLEILKLVLCISILLSILLNTWTTIRAGKAKFYSYKARYVCITNRRVQSSSTGIARPFNNPLELITDFSPVFTNPSDNYQEGCGTLAIKTSNTIFIHDIYDPTFLCEVFFTGKETMEHQKAELHNASTDRRLDKGKEITANTEQQIETSSHQT